MSDLDFNAIGNKFGDNLTVASMQGLADDTFRKSFEDLVQRLNADAGAVWIVDSEKPEELTIAINVGARGNEIEGQVSQELASGLVSKSFREEKLIHDEGRFRAAEQSDSVDMELQQMTNYQIALPFFMFGKKIGAVTAVQVSTLQKPTRAEWGFKPECFDTLTNWVATAQRLLEYAEVRRNG